MIQELLESGDRELRSQVKSREETSGCWVVAVEGKRTLGSFWSGSGEVNGAGSLGARLGLKI